MGAQRRERRRLLATRPATLRISRARAHRVYAGELGRARTAAAAEKEEARRVTEGRMWEAAGRARAPPAGGKVDYEANRQALIELKNTKLRLQDDRRWERLAKDTGELGDYHWATTWEKATRQQEEERRVKYTRRAIGCIATAAIIYVLFSIFSLAFDFTPTAATNDSAVVPVVASSPEVHPGSVASIACAPSYNRCC